MNTKIIEAVKIKFNLNMIGSYKILTDKSAERMEKKYKV